MELRKRNVATGLDGYEKNELLSVSSDLMWQIKVCRLDSLAVLPGNGLTVAAAAVRSLNGARGNSN